MTLLNAPFGLVASRSIGAPTQVQNEYYHSASDSVALFSGDPVISNDNPSSLNATSGVVGVPDGTPIAKASGTITTTAIRGVVLSVRPTYSNLTLQYAPASTGCAVNVCDNPEQLFIIQSNGTVATSDMGNTCGITSGSGSTTVGTSAYVLTETVGTSSYVLRIVRLAPIINNALAAYGIVEVSINLHELRNTAG